MRETHTATSTTPLGQHRQAWASRTLFRRGPYLADTWVRHRRHPKLRFSSWRKRWAPLLKLAVGRRQRPGDGEAVGGTWLTKPCELSTLSQLIIAVWVVLAAWREALTAGKVAAPDRSRKLGERASLADDNQRHGHQPLRVAYLGPIPRQGAGGPVGCAWLILEELARFGVRLDCYLTVTDDREQLDAIARWPEARVISFGSAWRWNRWYSKGLLMATFTGLGTTALGRRRLLKLLVKHHELAPYDAVYQFSTIEVFGRRKDRGRLPPMVLQPEVHAAGELRWMRKERQLSRRCEGWVRPQLVMGWLRFRRSRQRRDIRQAAVVLAISKAFGRHLIEDYGVEPKRIRIAPNPIDLEGFHPSPRPVSSDARPLKIAMVGRLSVRKGLELTVQLSHRLSDLLGIAHFEIVGDITRWSDYRRLLDDLNPSMATFHGSLSSDELKQWLPTCDLLIQPAKYEPFGLTVGEALASGVPVVVTTAVGAGEGVSEACCIRIPPEDLNALEEAVRGMVARLHLSATPVRNAARLEAERLWSATSVARRVEAALLEVAELSALRRRPRQGRSDD